MLAAISLMIVMRLINTQFLLRGESKFSSAIILTRQRKIPFSVEPIWTWISDLHQFKNSFVSLKALEDLLMNGLHCPHLKLMESLLIVKIAGWVFDSMATCLWRVGIHDQDWHFILRFRIIYTSSAL